MKYRISLGLCAKSQSYEVKYRTNSNASALKGAINLFVLFESDFLLKKQFNMIPVKIQRVENCCGFIASNRNLVWISVSISNTFDWVYVRWHVIRFVYIKLILSTWRELTWIVYRKQNVYDIIQWNISFIKNLEWHNHIVASRCVCVCVSNLFCDFSEMLSFHEYINPWMPFSRGIDDTIFWWESTCADVIVIDSLIDTSHISQVKVSGSKFHISNLSLLFCTTLTNGFISFPPAMDECEQPSTTLKMRWYEDIKVVKTYFDGITLWHPPSVCPKGQKHHSAENDTFQIL